MHVDTKVAEKHVPSSTVWYWVKVSKWMDI